MGYSSALIAAYGFYYYNEVSVFKLLPNSPLSDDDDRECLEFEMQ